MNTNKQLRTFFLRTLVGALSVSALIGIIIFLFGEFGDVEIRVLLTTLALGGFSLTGLSCSTIYDQEKLRLFSILGMAVAVLGFVINLIGIWELWDSDWTWRIMAGFIIVAVAFAHASLLLRLTPKTNTTRYIRSLTLYCIAIVAAMLVWATGNEFENSDFYFRMLGVFAILDVLGTIMMPVLNSIAGSNDA